MIRLAAAVFAALALSVPAAHAAKPAAAEPVGQLAQMLDEARRMAIETYMAVVDANLESAAPLPPPVREALAALVGKPGIPFATVDIESARWKTSERPIARVLFPQTYGQRGRAITHGTLILVNDDFLTGELCAVTARWAHEVTHVFQNRRDGRVEFLDRYLRESIEKGYEDISYEQEAYAVQRTAERAMGCGK